MPNPGCAFAAQEVYVIMIISMNQTKATKYFAA